MPANTNNYAATVAVATASYPATAQYVPTNGGELCIQHSGNVNNLITFSFDGTNDAGIVQAGTAVTMSGRYKEVFFKGAAATSTTLYVTTEFVR